MAQVEAEEADATQAKVESCLEVRMWCRLCPCAMHYKAVLYELKDESKTNGSVLSGHGHTAEGCPRWALGIGSQESQAGIVLCFKLDFQVRCFVSSRELTSLWTPHVQRLQTCCSTVFWNCGSCFFECVREVADTDSDDDAYSVSLSEIEEAGFFHIKSAGLSGQQ